MLLSETVRVVIFISFVAGIYLMAAAVGFRRLGRRLSKGALPESRRDLWISRAILGLAAGGLLCMAYGYFVEPYWLAVTRLRIPSAKLSTAGEPIRVVHISDIHSDPSARLEERLPDVIAREKPDLIIFTGDAINSPEALPVFKRCLARLARIAPTFVVKGNWDAAFWTRLDLFGGTGVRELDNEAVKVEVRGNELWVAGVAFPAEGRTENTLGKVPHGAFTLFLYHSPDEIEVAARKKVDLYSAGHTHGGQVALPLYGALVTLSRFGKKYERGLYRVSDTWLYVSRGIGMEGESAPRVRFWSRPEVTVFTIVPTG